MNAQLLARLEAIEAKRGGDLLIYTHEKPDGKGGLILMSDRRFDGVPVEVGRVNKMQVRKHRREVIRIQSGRGRGD